MRVLSRLSFWALPALAALLMGQDLKRVRPQVLAKAGKTPQNTQRFQGSRRDDCTAVKRLPTKLPDNIGHHFLGGLVVPAEEHGRNALFVMRVDHLSASNAVKRLHYVCLGDQSLQLFRGRF